MSQRMLLAFVSSFGFFNVYLMRVNLSVAIIDMVKVRERARMEAQQQVHWS